jgi:trk system potassium uptake protein TrkA
MTRGIDIMELSTAIRGEARFFEFVISDDDTRHVSDLELPDEARAVCLYRDDRFTLVDESTRLHKGDEIIVLTHSKNLPELRRRWHPESREINGSVDRD